MTTYPNREHQAADQAAMRRALKALTDIKGEAEDLHLRLSRDQRVDADDAQTITGKVRDLIGYLAELATLRDVREWHAADQAANTGFRFQCQGCGLRINDEAEAADHKERHGLVINIGPVNDLGGQDPHPRFGADEVVT
jgi:hypothetical protein